MMIPESDKTSIQAQADACRIEPPSQESVRAFSLAAMRCGRIRLQLLQLEIDEIGIALRFNMITPEFAIGWLDHIGALDFINSPDALREQGGAS